MACEPIIARRSAAVDDESLAEFVRRRFGREVLHRVAEPVIASLFAADADRLSLRMTMPRFLDLEAKHGSVTRGLRRAASSAQAHPFGHGTGRAGFVTVAGGLSRIVDTLVARLPHGTVRTGARVVGISRSCRAEEWRIHLARRETVRARAVLLACPAWQAAELLHEHDAELARNLTCLRYASCATVSIAYRELDVRQPIEGFGFFVPRRENLPILACSYISRKFPDRSPAGVAVFRAFLGGATRPEALDADDDALIRRTHDTLRSILAITGAPLFAKAYRAEHAMPQFDVGIRRPIDAIEDRTAMHPGLFLAGSIKGAFGLPDCIRSGEDAAVRAASFLATDQRPVVAVPTDPESPVLDQLRQ